MLIFWLSDFLKYQNCAYEITLIISSNFNDVECIINFICTFGKLINRKLNTFCKATFVSISLSYKVLPIFLLWKILNLINFLSNEILICMASVMLLISSGENNIKIFPWNMKIIVPMKFVKSHFFMASIFI